MLLKEVLEKTGLTRKALEYYEAQGLIRPAVLENGYRDYTGADVAALREIAVLRSCGLSIAGIRELLISKEKRPHIEAALGGLDAQAKALAAARERLARLAEAYDISAAYAELRQSQEAASVKERMLQAFPGGYGQYLALHFGRFLEEPIRTEAQREAYEAIIRYWDAAQVNIPVELLAMLEEAMPAGKVDTLFTGVDAGMQQMLENPAAYVEANRQTLDGYVDFRLSEEFAASPAGRLQVLLLEFQKQTGYQEIFLTNLKKLSPAYAAFIASLESANTQFLAAYPRAAALEANKE